MLSSTNNQDLKYKSQMLSNDEQEFVSNVIRIR